MESMLKLNLRQQYYDKYNFKEPLEFDRADLGPAGGVQVWEHIQKNLKRMQKKDKDAITDRSMDRILRHAGDPDAKLPWPHNANSKQTLDQRMERVEDQLIKL